MGSRGSPRTVRPLAFEVGCVGSVWNYACTAWRAPPSLHRIAHTTQLTLQRLRRIVYPSQLASHSLHRTFTPTLHQLTV
eukprot:5775720-Pyramimonas_sp.AAC.1